MLKQILVTLAAFQFACPGFALDAGAIAPFTPDEAVVANLEEVGPQMTGAINIIASLPPYAGGTKAAGLATQSDPHPDITGPGGKSNFEKMRLRFRELGLGSE